MLTIRIHRSFARTHARTLAILALGCTVLWGTRGAAANDTLAPDHVVPSVGIPLTTPWSGMSTWPMGSTDNLVVMQGPPAPDGRALYAWARDPGAKAPGWAWVGLLPIAGTAPTGTPHSTYFSIVAHGSDTIAYTQFTEGATVIRKIGDEWVYRGILPLEASWSSRMFSVDRDVAFTTTSTAVKFWKYDEKAAAWVQTAQFPLDTTGGGTNSINFGIRCGINNGVAIVPGFVPNDAWATGRTSVRVFSLADPHNPVQIDEIVVGGESPFAYKQGMALGAEWLALRSSVRTDAWLDARIEFHRRAPDGTFERTQVLPQANRTMPRVFRGNHFLAGSAVWTLGPDGQWYEGAHLSSTPSWITDDGCIGVTPSLELAVWTDFHDCDGDGQNDALAIGAGLVQDCNRNGRPDSCDIASGMLADANRDGTPDVCEGDCDGNGTPDLTQILDGAATACDDPTLLAVCAIANGASDVNGDGVVDACGPDTDGDGVPDVVQIAAGGSADCGGDWVPDAYPSYGLVEGDSGYYLDYWVLSGLPPAPAATVMVAAGFDTKPAQAWITQVSLNVRAGDPTHPWNPVGREYKVHIFSDPNGDQFVDDGELLWSGSAIHGPGEVLVMDVPGVHIDTVAFVVAFEAPQGAWVRIDAQGSSVQSSAFGGYYGLNSYNALRNDIRQNGTYCYTQGGPFLVSPLEALAGGRRSYEVLPGILVTTSGCPLAGDITGDGLVNGADLGQLLSAWGPGPSVADLNGDGVVDGADLGVLLSTWSADQPSPRL